MFEFAVVPAFIFFATKRLLTYLHVFQQEEYDNKRFLSWLIFGQNYDKKLSLYLSAIIILSLTFSYISQVFISSAIIVGFIGFALREKNPLKDAKKKLVLTQRTKRIYALAFVIVVIATLTLPKLPIIWLFLVHLIPFGLMLAIITLTPYEAHTNKKFRNEAVEKLSKVAPYIIAITGSYGKTSTKHILGHLLQNYAPTLFTPGSVNTEMGITRVIREQLQPHHQYFIVEMGAYAIGSIARLCALTPPKLSLISAIGQAHFERFKSLEETAKAKFEIAEATITNNGQIIIHTQALGRDYAKNFVRKYKNNFTICGDGKEVQALNPQQTKEGLSFEIIYDSKKYPITVPIYGLHHMDNIILAFATAIKIGMKPKDVITTLKSLPQVKHRLEVKALNGYTIIDDAYNSNPKGFRNALELLDTIADKDGRRILITPGMTEIGENHEKEHAILGELAANKTDIAIIISPKRLQSFIDSYTSSSKNRHRTLLTFDTFKEAQNWLTENVKAKDVVLLENDLPDLYESKIDI